MMPGEDPNFEPSSKMRVDMASDGQLQWLALGLAYCCRIAQSSLRLCMGPYPLLNLLYVALDIVYR